MQEKLQLKPDHFIDHQFTKSFNSPHKVNQIWEWLNDPKTFTDNQVWPYRVEFLTSEENDSIFETGVLNNHHGPFLSLAGKIGEINPTYRDLKYFYGSYAISFRFIRPYRLEFWTEDQGSMRSVKVRLSSYVNPSFHNLWIFSQKIFWSRFGSWMNKSIQRRIKTKQS